MLCLISLVPFNQAAESAESLRDYVLRSQHRQAYGVYLKNQKFGWAIDELKLGQFEGKDVATYSFEMHGSFKTDNSTASFEDRTITIYSLDQNGEIIAVEGQSKEDGNETTREIRRDSDGMIITSRSDGMETIRRVNIPKENLKTMRDLETWLTNSPKKGEKLESYSTAWEQENIDVRETFTFQGKKTILWGGVKTEVNLVSVNVGGMIVNCEITSDGIPIRGMVGGLFELRAEEESIAKAPGTNRIDMIEASSIKVDKRLGAPEDIDTLVLEIEGFGSFPLPLSHRQQLVSRKGKTVVLKLIRDKRTELSNTLSAFEQEYYLRSTPTLQSDQAPIKNLAGEIAGNELDPLKKAALFKDWLYKNMRQTMASNRSTAIDVEKSRAGDCTEITLLFVALARAAGIPAREVGGIVYANEKHPIFGWHAWAEIHDGSQWVSVDPTWNQIYVDATHLKLAEGSEDLTWVNLLGKLRIKVVNFSKGR